MNSTKDTRRWHLAQIHKLQRTLELGDEAYRNILFLLTGKRSCADMSPKELETVYRFMFDQQVKQSEKTLGFISDEEALAVFA